MRISWLYFARRSDLDSDPVLICPQLVATARSAMVEILSLARPMRHHGGIARAVRHIDGGQGLAQAADLVHLDENRIRDALFDSALEDLDVGDKDVVADQLNLPSRSCR